MTKRKQAAKTATTVTPGPKAISTNHLSLDSANPSAGKKAQISESSNNLAVSGHISGGDLDIDNIFQQARKTKQAPIKSEKKPKAVSKAPRVVGSKDNLFGTGQPKQRRYDAEGLPVYTPEELNVGAGGQTDKCPFDCDCCF